MRNVCTDLVGGRVSYEKIVTAMIRFKSRLAVQFVPVWVATRAVVVEECNCRLRVGRLELRPDNHAWGLLLWLQYSATRNVKKRAVFLRYFRKMA